MSLSAYVLSAALAACAPQIYPSTMASIIAIEDGSLDQFAIHDNATDRSYYGLSWAQAAKLARSFVEDGPESQRCQIASAAGRSCTIDVGVAQINSSNFAHYGVTPAQAFDLATNVWIGGRILYSAWRTAEATAQDAASWDVERGTYAGAPDPRQVVLRSAISIYNSNSAWRSAHYVSLVLDASQGSFVRTVTAQALQWRKTARPCRQGEDFSTWL